MFLLLSPYFNLDVSGIVVNDYLMGPQRLAPLLVRKIYQNTDIYIVDVPQYDEFFEILTLCLSGQCEMTERPLLVKSVEAATKDRGQITERKGIWAEGTRYGKSQVIVPMISMYRQRASRVRLSWSECRYVYFYDPSETYRQETPLTHREWLKWGFVYG